MLFLSVFFVIIINKSTQISPLQLANAANLFVHFFIKKQVFKNYNVSLNADIGGTREGVDVGGKYTPKPVAHPTIAEYLWIIERKSLLTYNL